MCYDIPMNGGGCKLLGDIFKTARLDKGLSQEQCAVFAGISANAYRAIEKNSASPKFDTVVALCQVLGLVLEIDNNKFT